MAKYLILASRFNEMITKPLVDGALDVFNSRGFTADVDTTWVPGSFELPATANVAAKSNKYSAIVCIGAVIKGETPHFDYVCSQVASGLMNVSLKHELPVIFGVLTTNNVEEALNRAGLKMGNKGREAAEAALEMTSTFSKFRES